MLVKYKFLDVRGGFKKIRGVRTVRERAKDYYSIARAVGRERKGGFLRLIPSRSA